MRKANQMKKIKSVEEKDVVTDKKLTDWPKEPSVADLKEDLLMAKPAHDEMVAKVSNWLDLRNAPRRDQAKSRESRRTQSTIQPKLVRRQAEWRYPALSEPFLSDEKTWKVGPRTFEDVQSARQNEMVLNYQFRTKMNPVRFIDHYVRAAVDEGTCIVKIGWDRETVMEKVMVPVWQYVAETDPGMMQALEQNIQLMQEDPSAFKNLPEDAQESVRYSMEAGVYATAYQVGEEEVEREKVLVNKPSLEVLDVENVYIDPSAGDDITKAKFAIITFETSKADLLKDGRYTNLNRVNWSSNDPMHHPDHASYSDMTQQFKDELRKRVVAYEYWGFYDVDGNDTLTPIVATWIGDTMIRMEENPFPDQQIPLVIVPYLPVKGSTHGEPDAELLGDNQDVIGAMMRGIIDIMAKSANGQKGIAKGALDAVNLRKFKSGEDYEFNPGSDPKYSFHTHTFNEIPNSALTMLTMQNQEAEALTGVKAFSGGMSGAAYGDVAAGIRGMLDAASKREMSILRRLAQGMSEIGRKIISMNGVFLSEEEVVSLTNEQFVTIRREDLIGEFNTQVDISTAEVEEAKSQDLGFMLQTLGNTIPWEITKGLLAEIARLKKMPLLAHQISSYNPEPDPLAQKMKELEIAKVEAEIADIRARSMLAQAKARAEMANADLKDLDFIEQETGTKHAREKDLMQAQAESNQMLEITKSILSPKQEGEMDSKNERIGAGLALHTIASKSV